MTQKIGSGIDLVYLWVDGTDPGWRERRSNTYEKISDTSLLESYANVEGRFRNNNELQFSLRSIEKYFPDHGTIHIITDNQIPPFLREDHTINIIPHSAFKDSGDLPTFSSKSLEASLVDIPEISDTFLYMNDDVFLGPQFSFSDVFSHKPIYYFVTSEYSSTLPSEGILSSHYHDYSPIPHFIAHTPKIVIKQEYMAMREEFYDIFCSVKSERFRMRNNPSLLADFYPRWMIYHGKGIYGGQLGEYYMTTDPECMNMLRTQFDDSHFFCINDTHDDVSDLISFQAIGDTLQDLLPSVSRFEK